MSDQPDAGPTHAWEQLWKWWLVMFGAAAAVCIVVLALDERPALPLRLLGIGLIVVLVAMYFVVGFPAMKIDDARRGGWYIAAAIAIEAGLLAIHPIAFVLLFGLYPQLYAAFNRMRHSVIAGVVLTVVTGVASFGWSGWDSEVLPAVLIQMSFTTAFGMVFGIWITRIIRQSGERATLIAELETTRGELAAANRLAGETAERERLAGEIHDTLAQGFTSIILLAQTAQAKLAPSMTGRDVAGGAMVGGDVAGGDVPGPALAGNELAAIERTARDNLAEARALVAALQPAGLAGSSLPEALRRIVGQLAQETSTAATLELRGAPRPLGSAIEVAVLRGAQETLANIRRHAQASAATVELDYDAAGPVELIVRDDGIGFEPAAAGGGYGLAGLYKRAALLGGTVRVESSPGAGTTVRMRLP